MRTAQFATPEGSRTSGENPPIVLAPMTNLDWAARTQVAREYVPFESAERAASVVRWHERVRARNKAASAELRRARKITRAHKKPVGVGHAQNVRDILAGR